MHICVGDFLLDIVQNSFEAESSQVELVVQETSNILYCSVQDNGKGMDAETQRRVLDPFYTDGIKHKKRKVGLGLPFLYQATDACEGTFNLESEVGKGTRVVFSFNLEHLDAPPIGDLTSVFVALLSHPLSRSLVIQRSVESEKGSGMYTLDKDELQDILGPMDTSGTLSLLRQYIASQEEDVLQLRSVIALHMQIDSPQSKQQEM
jgi:hypothetical protein